jgi:hypothetical protein
VFTHLAKVDTAEERVHLRRRGICYLSDQRRLGEIDERCQAGALIGGLDSCYGSVGLREGGRDRTHARPKLTDPARILCIIPGGTARLVYVHESIWAMLTFWDGGCRHILLGRLSCRRSKCQAIEGPVRGRSCTRCFIRLAGRPTALLPVSTELIPSLTILSLTHVPHCGFVMSHAFRRLRHTRHPALDLTTFRLFLPGSSWPGVGD